LLSKVKNSRYYLLLLSVLSGVLLGVAWLFGPLSFTLLFAFVPLLRVESYISSKGLTKPGRAFWRYAYITLFVWNLCTTWWTANTTAAGVATAAGGIFAIFANSLLQSIPLALFGFTKRSTTEVIGYLSLPIYWITFEYIHLNWDLSWPWLTLGNGFLYMPQWVQWYEFTGVLGGTLWVWVANLLVYVALLKYKGMYTPQGRVGVDVYVLAVLIVPMLLSYYLYNTYEEKGEPVEIVVVQPNIDPYTEKFVGTERFIPFDEQVRRFIQLSESQITPKTKFVVWPETAIDGAYQEDALENEPLISQIKGFVNQHPQLSLLTGITSWKRYSNKEAAPAAARYREDLGYYDVFNTGMFVATGQHLQFYHKSKLVPGVEILPYPGVLGVLTKLVFDLGGTAGSLGRQDERTVFKNNEGQGIAPAICYESIYGEFMGEYVQNGADFITIITNDGWWGKTPGHRQHLAYASLRAIESRRSIARSANTGISGFVNQRGDLLYATEYWVQQAVNGTILANKELTFYVKYGDYIGRIAQWLALGVLLFSIVKNRMKRTEKTEVPKAA
jgi:apolipoprotein N-acyltransferase